MTDETGDGPGPSQRAVELGTALAFAGFGVIAVIGSLRVGIGWGAEGPRSGFFPFYVGLVTIASGLVNLLLAMRIPSTRQFAAWSHLRQVIAIVIPTAVYVAVIPWLGIYVASIVLIAGFMLWLDRYHPAMAIGIAVAVVAATFMTFEWWFLVPLPKGPIEDLLGL